VLAIVLVVLVGLLVVADFAARSYAENRVASQIKNQGFPTKPSVTIDGFPFLTQLAARDFSEVQISSGSITEGPLQIQSIGVTLNRILVNSSFSGGTVSNLDGNANITFTALGNAMTTEASGLAQLVSGALTLSSAGSDEVKATLGVDGIGATVVWQVTVPTADVISITPVSGLGPLDQVLGPKGIGPITLKLPPLPLGLNLASINVTPSGLVATVTGQNVSFGS
jgi:hypothetical protein